MPWTTSGSEKDPTPMEILTYDLRAATGAASAPDDDDDACDVLLSELVAGLDETSMAVSPFEFNSIILIDFFSKDCADMFEIPCMLMLDRALSLDITVSFINLLAFAMTSDGPFFSILILQF